MRWIELKGAANARDTGGLPTVDGRRTATNSLLRADNLQGLTPDDVDVLVRQIGLSTVIDLRTEFEVESEGPGPLTGVESVRHLQFSVLPEAGQATDAAADALLTRVDRARERYPDDLVCAFYLGYLEDRPDSILGALHAVNDAHGAALVHCAAGKDRTGVVVAIALEAAGVERSAIVADYAASGDRIGAILDRLRASPTYAADIDRRPADEHRPRAATMEAFLAQLDLEFGGARGWLAKHGFKPTDLERLRTKLITGAPGG